MSGIKILAPLPTFASVLKQPDDTTGATKAKDIDEAAVRMVADFLLEQGPAIIAALPKGNPSLPAPKRGPVSAAEAPQIIRAAGGIDAAAAAADTLRGIMARTSPLVDGVFKAVANGTLEAPERIKAGTEFAALRAEMNAFHVDNTGTEEEEVLEGIAGNPGQPIERTRTAGWMAMMAKWSHLLMQMKEHDRNQSTAELQKSESFVDQAGERLVQGAKEHLKGAIGSAGAQIAMGAAGGAISLAGVKKGVESFSKNEKPAIADLRKANKMDFDLAHGRTTKPGAPSADQHTVLTASNKRFAAQEKLAIHTKNLSQTHMTVQAGQTVGQMGTGIGRAIEVGGELNQAHKTHEQQILQKASETSKAASDHAKQRADERGTLQSQIESKMASIMDDSHSAMDSINRNMA